MPNQIKRLVGLIILMMMMAAVSARGEVQGSASLFAVNWNAPFLSQEPTIDGKLDEWRSLPPMKLGLQKNQVAYPLQLETLKVMRGDAFHQQWGGPPDCSARGWVGWNDKYLFFAADITDDKFCQDRAPSLIYENDSLQFAFDPQLDCSKGKYQKDDSEYWWAAKGNETVGYCYRGAETGERKDLKVRALRKSGSGGWTIEGALPWEEIGFAPAAGKELGFSWLVNDSDGGQPDVWLEWTPGVAGKADPSRFAVLTLSKETPPAYSAEKDYSAMLQYYQNQIAAAAGQPDKAAEAQVWRGHTQAFFGKPEAAKSDYQEVLSKFPDTNSVNAAVRGLFLRKKSEQGGEAAIAFCDGVIGENEDHPAILLAAFRQLGEAYLQISAASPSGESLLAELNALGEIPKIKNAATLDDFLTMVMFAESMEDPARAETLREELLRRFSNDWRVANARIALAQQQINEEKYDLAEKNLLLITRIYSRHELAATAGMSLAELYIMREDFKKAVGCLQRIGDNPKFTAQSRSQAYLRAGTLLHFNLRDSAGARKMYKAAARVGDDSMKQMADRMLGMLDAPNQQIIRDGVRSGAVF